MTPKKGSSANSKLGEISSGSLNVRPSSPPVNHESCDASVWNADATASVIIAKKIALTRSENRPTANDSTSEINSDRPKPVSTAPQPGPMRVADMAMP